eukprot:gene30764-37170_t
MAEAALTGGSPKRRFQDTAPKVLNEDLQSVLQEFVRQLLTGRNDEIVKKYFGAFSSVSATGQVTYPLCYVKEMINELSSGTTWGMEMMEPLAKLEVSTEQEEGSGMEMQCIVQIAILLRCFCVRSFGAYSPFGIVPDDVKPALAFSRIPAEYTSLTKATSFIDAEISMYRAPTLIYMAPASQRFEGVVGLIAYTDGVCSLKYGYKVTIGDNRRNVAVFDSSELDREYLLRGQVIKSRNPKVSTQKGWRYLSVKEIGDFIGASLRVAVPPDKFLDVAAS